MAFFL